MRIVVTGGAGFLGSHLCDALIARGDEVVAVDNLSTGRRENIAHLESNGRFTFVQADISVELPVTGAVDGVLNFASPASPPEYLMMPLETMDVGSLGTRNALEVARRNDARFLQASTSEIYGDPLVHPQTEDYFGNVDPTSIRAVYDEAKRFAETMTMTYHRQFGTRTAIVRIFNTYGPRLRPGDGRVVSNFLAQALDGAPITIYGTGNQTRSFCFVEDEIRGILALFDSDITVPVNIGNTAEMTMIDLAKLVLEITESTSEIVYMPIGEGDPARRRPDLTRANTLLGWAPRIGVAEGLARMRDWYVEERARDGA